MNELIIAYEAKIAAMQETISGQKKLIDRLKTFLVDLANDTNIVLESSHKKQAFYTAKIEELKTNQDKVVDQDTEETPVTPATDNSDDFLDLEETDNSDDNSDDFLDLEETDNSDDNSDDFLDLEETDNSDDNSDDFLDLEETDNSDDNSDDFLDLEE